MMRPLRAKWIAVESASWEPGTPLCLVDEGRHVAGTTSRSDPVKIVDVEGETLSERGELGKGTRSGLRMARLWLVAIGLATVPACDWSTLTQGVDLDKVVATELKKKSGAEVVVGSASLSWGGALTLEKVEFAPGKDGALIQIPRLTWGLDLGRGWNSLSSLATLTVEDPVIRVNRGSDEVDGGDLLAKLVDPENASMRPGQVEVRGGRVVLEDFADTPQEVTALLLSADLSVPDQARFQASATAPGEIPFSLMGHHDRVASRTELAVTVDRVPAGPLTLEKVQAAFIATPREVELTSLSVGAVGPVGPPLQAGPGRITRSTKKKSWSFDELPAKLGDAAIQLSGHWGSDLDHELRVEPAHAGLASLGASRPGSLRADLRYQRTKKERKLTGELALAGFDLPLTVKGHAIPARLEKGTFRFKGGAVKASDAAFQVGALSVKPVIEVAQLFEKPQIVVTIPETKVDLDQVIPYLDAKAAKTLTDLQARGAVALEGKLTGTPKDPDFQGALRIVEIWLNAPAAGGELKIAGGTLEHGEAGWSLKDGKIERDGTTWSLGARVLPKDSGMRVEGEATAANRSLRGVLGAERGARLDPASTAKVDVTLAFVAEGDTLERQYSVTPRGGKLRMGTSGSWIQLGDGGRISVVGESFTLEDVPLDFSGRSVELSGKATPAGGGYALSGLAVRVGGQTLQGSGQLDVDPVSLDLDLASQSFDPAALVGGGKLSLAGKMPVALKVKGTPPNLSVDGQLSLAGARVKGGGLETLEVTSGTLRFTGKRAVLDGVRVAMDGAGFTVTGAIEDPLGGGRYDDVRISGTVPFALIAPGKGLSGSGHLETTITGSVSSPKVNGKLTADRLVTSSTTITGLSARVDSNKKGIVLDDLRATVEGHRVTGRLVLPKDGALQHDIEIHGLSVSSLGAGRGGVLEGSFQLSLAGSGMGSSMRSKGTLTSRDMVVHAQRIPQIAGARGKVKAGVVGAQLLGALLGDRNLGDLARAGGAQAEYYGQMVDQLSASHALGPVRARVSIDPEKVVLNPIEGRKIIGRLTIDRDSDRLSGRLDKLNLGGVEISDIKIKGTTSKPDFDVDLDNVAMAGGGGSSRSRRSRGGMQEVLGGALPGGGGGSMGEDLLGQVLGGRSGRSRRSGGANILGDLLGGGGGNLGRSSRGSSGRDIGGALLQQLLR